MKHGFLTGIFNHVTDTSRRRRIFSLYKQVVDKPGPPAEKTGLIDKIVKTGLKSDQSRHCAASYLSRLICTKKQIPVRCEGHNARGPKNPDLNIRQKAYSALFELGMEADGSVLYPLADILGHTDTPESIRNMAIMGVYNRVDFLTPANIDLLPTLVLTLIYYETGQAIDSMRRLLRKKSGLLSETKQSLFTGLQKDLVNIIRQKPGFNGQAHAAYAALSYMGSPEIALECFVKTHETITAKNEATGNTIPTDEMKTALSVILEELFLHDMIGRMHHLGSTNSGKIEQILQNLGTIDEIFFRTAPREIVMSGGFQKLYTNFLNQNMVQTAQANEILNSLRSAGERRHYDPWDPAEAAPKGEDAQPGPGDPDVGATGKNVVSFEEFRRQRGVGGPLHH